MMKTLIELSSEFEKRRRHLALNQKDMLMKIGMSQQQYQRIETGGDARVSTLLRILEGLGLELMLVPRERVQQIRKMLKSDDGGHAALSGEVNGQGDTEESPWSSMLRALEDE